MDISNVVLCCQYCKMEFWIKDELYFHWYKSCAKLCACDNCHVPVYVKKDTNNKIGVFYNKTNLDVPVVQVLQHYFPQVKFENIFARDSSGLSIKRIKMDEDVEMQEV